jgi:glycosyltransferase involved in cell wall biosynthesis
MRIGFETSSLTTNKPTGIARYIQQLIPAINDEIGLYDDVSFLYKASRLKYRQHWWRLEGVNIQLYYNSFWPIIKNVDVIHGMDGFIPNWKKPKKVITIHDLAAVKLNDNSVSSIKFQSRRLRRYEEVREYTDAIIADSETTKNDVVNLLNISPKKVHVSHLGVDERYSPQGKKIVKDVLSKHNLPEDYLLFVGSISGRKNTARLVEAFAQSKASKMLKLVFAGAISYQGEKTFNAIKKNQIEKKVIILDYIADRDLPALYSGAKGFVFPTLYEGFGLPILEAMACGTPVLTSNVGAAPEISDKWAIHVNPYAIDDIAYGIDSLLDFPQDQIRHAIAHAKSFTWKKCAKRTFTVYKKLLED